MSGGSRASSWSALRVELPEMVAIAERRAGTRLAGLTWLGLPLALLVANLLLWSSNGGWWRAVQQVIWQRRLVLERWSETMLQPFVEQVALVFLGLLFEALPFLLLGAAVSGVLSTQPVLGSRLARWLARRWGFVAALLGGFLFPVCECGVVPVARRLWQFGTPLPLAIAFLLAAPILNPVGIASTWFSFAQQPGLAAGRFILTALVAAGASLVLWRWRLLHAPPAPGAAHEPTARRLSWVGQLLNASAHGYEDLVRLGRYFVVGTLVAAVLQRIVPPTTPTRFLRGAAPPPPP